MATAKRVPLAELAADLAEITGRIVGSTVSTTDHLGRSPWLTCSYWSPEHDAAFLDCRAEWTGPSGPGRRRGTGSRRATTR